MLFRSILIGTVGQDPEVSYLEGGNAVATFPLATAGRGYKTQSGARIPYRTEWHNIVAWRGLAEVIERYVKKGTSIYIEGKLRSRSWEDQNGIKRYTTEVYVDNLELLGRRPENGAPADNQGYAQQGTAQQAADNQKTNAPLHAENGHKEADDLPF